MKSGNLGFSLGLAIPFSLWLIWGAAAERSDGMSRGTFRDDRPAAAQWWLPERSAVPFEILGANDKRLISAVPFSSGDEYPILLRVGARAQNSGDSRTLGYFSEEIHDPGEKESQALYGINAYSGSATTSQLGVHGMAQSRPGAGQAIVTIVGTQGFASHLDLEGGQTHNVIGVSGVGQTGKNEEIRGTVHNLIGVHGMSQSRSATHVNQAISVYAKAPEISGSGTVRVAAAGRFDQPGGASKENHAILVGGAPDELSIGFLPTADGEAARSIAWKESSRSFEFSHAPRLPVHDSTNRPAPGVPGKLIFNTDHGNINIDTGSNWILPNGKRAK